jgi:putative oxidoreductase
LHNPTMAALGLLVLRLALAVVIVAHGCHKLFGAFAGPGIGPGGLSATAASFQGFGLPAAYQLAVVAGLTQFVGGILIGAGWFTRWAALANFVYIVVGIWVEHRKWGFFLNWLFVPDRGHGIEYSIIFAGALICLALSGAGEASIDGLRQRSAAARAAGRERLRRRA